jgi:DNA-binding CsgD family transcriptional regulator
VLVGREEALARITWVVSGARAGRGGALLLRGEPGSGKTALLAAAAESADGMTVLRCAGTQDERDLPYAALHALVRPLRSVVAGLVPAQRDALDLALGDVVGGKPAPLLVGAATLSLLDMSASSTPLLVLVDDLQWIDVESRDAIGFAARRLGDDAAGVLLAVRVDGVAMSGVDAYDVPALDGEGAVELLAGLGVVRSVARRLATVAGGNPLSLVELARTLDDEQRRGAAPLPDPMPSTSPGAAYGGLMAALSQTARLAAATAAIAGIVPPTVLADALTRLGTDYDQLADVETSGLLRVTRTGVVWRHPLARAAAAAAVASADRRRVQTAVADALQRAGGDASAVVWHRVGAATGPDEGLAAALEGAAATAAARGAHQAAAQAWEAAARLGTDPARRLAQAALQAWAADDAESASRLLEESLPALRDADLRWSLSVAAGQIAHSTASPQAGWEWFVRAIEEARSSGCRDREVMALASAFNAALHMDDPERLSWLAERIRSVADPEDPVQDARSSAVQGFVLLNADQTEPGRRYLEHALDVIETRDLLASHPDLLAMTVMAVMWSGNPRRLRAAINAAVDRLRAAGDTGMLAATVRGLAWCDFSVAEWEAAAVRAEDALDLARICGRVGDIADALVQVATLEGARGHTVDALAHAREARRLAEAMDSPWRTADALWCEVLAAMSAGDLDALTAPTRALAQLLRAGRVAAAQPEFFDAPLALALTGRRAEAAELLDVLLSRTGDDARPESRAGELLARCAIGPDSAALADEAAALATRLEGVEYVFPRARLRMSAGSMRRRLGHRVEARAQLRGAEADFAILGATPWVVRTQEELRASGATLRSRAARDDTLTAAELRVVAAAVEGMSNKEIAAALFLSSKTVEFHLGRIYRKLAVRSRSELVRAEMTRRTSAAVLATDD